MTHRIGTALVLSAFTVTGVALLSAGQGDPPGQAKDQKARDPAADATRVQADKGERPEQKLTEHDRSEKFDPTKPAPLTDALKQQPKEDRITGFEFSRVPLNADKPFTPLAEVMKKESEAKPKVMEATGSCWRPATT